MVQDKNMAEANIRNLVQQFGGHVQQKLDLCKQRQKQQHSIHTSLTTASKYLMFTDSAPAALGWSADQAMQQNTSQLQMYTRLAASFQETQQARERLQQCIQKEEQLMSELAKPLQTCLHASIQVLEETHANMHVDFEGQEQKHAENLTRYVQIEFPLAAYVYKSIVTVPCSAQVSCFMQQPVLRMLSRVKLPGSAKSSELQQRIFLQVAWYILVGTCQTDATTIADISSSNKH